MEDKVRINLQSLLTFFEKFGRAAYCFDLFPSYCIKSVFLPFLSSFSRSFFSPQTGSGEERSSNAPYFQHPSYTRYIGDPAMHPNTRKPSTQDWKIRFICFFSLSFICPAGETGKSQKLEVSESGCFNLSESKAPIFPKILGSYLSECFYAQPPISPNLII